MELSDPRRVNSVLFNTHDDDNDDDVDEVLPSQLLLAAQTSTNSNELIHRIILPSAPSSRFRNALHRATTNPTKDVEAWQALITEVNACAKDITHIHAVDADTQQKLDWIESVYGALLNNFSYAAAHAHFVLELLLAQSARVGEERGPLVDRYGSEPSRRAQRCEAKFEHLLQTLLGVDMSGNPISGNVREVGEDGDTSPGTATEDQGRIELGGMCVWSVPLWLLYVQKAARDANREALALPAEERAPFVRERTLKAYNTAASHAGSSHDNHVFWKHYLLYVRSWTATADPTTNNADHALAQQQMIQLRSIYQQLIVHPMMGLDMFWQEYEAFELAQNEQLATALTQEFLPKYQHAKTVFLEQNRVYGAADLELSRLATDPVEETDEDYLSKMKDERRLLRVWKTRCSYQRTNPERLTSPELARRIRHSYKEMICVLTRHPECWHMWAMWELQGMESKKPERAIAVLKLGLKHVPDSTLLAYTQAQIAELHSKDPSECIAVMERFIAESPNTLGFVLCQQMVRRYKGIDEARAVFAKARRVLREKVGRETKKKLEGVDADVEMQEVDTATESANDVTGKSWMVTNRLDESVGTTQLGTDANGEEHVYGEGKMPMGIITWHLYASHATMEHRMNRAPDIAARVYELGLRKHSSFLTKPPYIKRYAQLLLELGDTVNLRALLTRAIAACEEQEKPSTLAALWDITLHFGAVLLAEKSSVSHLVEIEQKRRLAIVGPEVEDVATGGSLNASDVPLVGALKSTISEQLIRSEGYDISSNIVSGMSRNVDLLDAMGLWGSGNALAASHKVKQDKDDEISGSKSDAVYQMRLQYQTISASGFVADVVGGDGGLGTGTKLMSARERLQQGATAGPALTSAMMLAIQQSPDWLRPLLMLLPYSKLRLPIVAKPPPHLTELALSSLRNNLLPADRPTDTSSSNKRRIADVGGDSSDEENDAGKGSGYGNAFRNRQRQRLISQNETVD
jgi:hypothetical protein